MLPFTSIALLGLFTAVRAFPAQEKQSGMDSSQVTDILIPDADGKLVYAPQQNHTLERRINPLCLDHQTHNTDDNCGNHDPPDSTEPPSSPRGKCYQYCERCKYENTLDPVKISADIVCDTTTCPIAHINSIAISSSITISFGATSPPGESGAAVFTAGVSFEWSKTVNSGNTYTFNPSKGDDGFIAFYPKVRYSCGPFQQYVSYTEPLGTGMQYCASSELVTEDKEACGYSPVKLDSGEADGTYTFCRKGSFCAKMAK